LADTIEIEVLSALPKQQQNATPLLFVHGAYASAQQWAPFFLPFFAEQGYPAHAVSVRGHGGSGGRDDARAARLRDYVADALRVMDGLSNPPVLVGHSMGGMIVQKILVERAVPAAVLMCSAPPHGLLGSSLQAMFGNPVMFRDMAALQRAPESATVDGARRALFLDGTADDWIRRVLPRAEAESDAVMLDMTYRDLPPSRGRRDVPMLVLGAGRDACITRTAVRETARAFGVEAEMFEDLPHAMMLVPEWEQVARRILDWLSGVLPKPLR
jgi:pimeloyl-ACP methyl ester carboxylesterase